MKYTQPSILATSVASKTIQGTHQDKSSPSRDSLPSSAAAYEADE